MHCGDRWGSLIIDRGVAGARQTGRGNAPECKGILPKNIESIELKDFSGATNDVIGTAGDVETALKSIEDPQMDVAWVTQATRDLAGVREAMTRMRDELANNLAKLSDVDDQKSEVEKHLARERQKLTETDDIKFNKIFEIE